MNTNYEPPADPEPTALREALERGIDSPDAVERNLAYARVFAAARRFLELTETGPDPSMLAGVSELADRYDVQANTVAVWTQRHADFPEPLIQVGGRVRVWWVPDVDQWVESRR